MLAMDSRTTRGVRHPTLSLTTIASMLAPTGICSAEPIEERDCCKVCLDFECPQRVNQQ